MPITADFSGAIAKTRALLQVPNAAKKQATQWASETVPDLKTSGLAMQKSWNPGKGKSQMGRNVGMNIEGTAALWAITVGTGVGGTLSVKYAKIQDEGGTTHPGIIKGMAGIKAHAWKMLYGGQAAMAEKKFSATFKHAARGMAKIAGRQAAQRFGGMWWAIAHTDKPYLTVHIPASHWFTSVIDRREPILREMMDPETIFNAASQMTGGKG